MRRVFAVLAVGAVLQGCGLGPLVRKGRLNQPLIDEVSRSVETFRRLPLKQQVPSQLLTPAELGAWFATETDASFQPGDLERLEAVERHLGLLPADGALRPMVQKLYERQIAAFYDPRRKTFTVAQNPPAGGSLWLGLARLLNRDPVGEMLVAHELTHALQDQHFTIPTTPEPLTDSHGDRLLAQRALFEGDATLAGFAHIFGGRLDASAIDLVLSTLAQVPAQVARELPDIPDVLRTPLVFQYDHGARFAARALREHGWSGIDRAHRCPPVSTEQVLHPERYFDTPDLPVEITLAPLPRLLRAGWVLIAEDTMGELGTQLVLAQADRTLAIIAAAGWDGDRLQAYQRGATIVSRWQTVWDGETDADEFAAAVRGVFPAALVELRGTQVLVVQGGDAVDARQVAADTWAGTRITPWPTADQMRADR